MKPPQRYALRLLGTLLLVAVTFSGTEAQLITGRVLEAGTDRPLVSASVTVFDSARASSARAVSDSTGAFQLLPPMPGAYSLRVELLGYATLSTPPLDLALGRQLEVEVRLSAEAIALEPLTVVARSEYHAGRLHEYYQRAEWSRKLGRGRVYTRDDVERLHYPYPSSYLLMVPQRGGCAPTVLLDGLPTTSRDLDGLLEISMLEGVEIYRGPTEVPPEYHRYTRCGVALFWTRRDVPNGRPFSWKRLAIGVGLAAGMLLFLR
jgi:hypothetical protein